MFYVMIRFEVQILVGVGWFSVHGDMSTVIVIYIYTGVQERQDLVAFWFCCENNVQVNTVDVSWNTIYSEILPVTRDRSRQTSGHPALTIGAVVSTSLTKSTKACDTNIQDS